MNIESVRDSDLLQQHKEFDREGGYDGHNRHSGIITMHDLGMRRSRRRWRMIMREMARRVNSSKATQAY